MLGSVGAAAVHEIDVKEHHGSSGAGDDTAVKTLG
jgi:hypothetical protein